jgi:hypothetical protein
LKLIGAVLRLPAGGLRPLYQVAERLQHAGRCGVDTRQCPVVLQCAAELLDSAFEERCSDNAFRVRNSIPNGGRIGENCGDALSVKRRELVEGIAGLNLLTPTTFFLTRRIRCGSVV